MFINLKYHLASLVAVFLALGLGMLIGCAVPWEDSLANSQSQLTTSLESQLDQLKKNNQSLRSRIGSLEMQNNIQVKFERQVLPTLVSDRLKDRNIAVIDINGVAAPAELTGTLKAAGADIHSVTLLGELDFSPEGISRADGNNWAVETEKSLRIGREISRAVLTGDTAIVDVLAPIKKEGLYGGRLTDVVLIGGRRDSGESRPKSLDGDIIDYFLSQNINVFGVEESCIPVSLMNLYQGKKITTIDNIDTVPGLVALVYAIEGRPGSYGIKSTAKKILPDIDYGVVVNAR
ncbi:MAG: hypothetical protein JL50_15230 [Peptococcaceae bacterium BICA1-7]|nr:MAG: hypothetical protein JL50_15230 [Peptococcaceae bacterium BICA1-7]HBV96861.1 copper transporter [Desulfotomaculum sp.]